MPALDRAPNGVRMAGTERGHSAMRYAHYDGCKAGCQRSSLAYGVKTARVRARPHLLAEKCPDAYS
jgi:hypothetical protein